MDWNDMMTLPVFLSASLPAHPSVNPEKDKKYWETRNLLNLREAIRELAAMVLPEGSLVFGGHPAVNPLILGIAKRLDHDQSRREGETVSKHLGRVLVYQSRHFIKMLPPEIESFTHVKLTDAVAADRKILPAGEEGHPNSDREMSLRYMRFCMVGVNGPSWVGKAFPQAEDLACKRRERVGTDKFRAAFFLGGMDGVEQEFEIFRAFHPGTPVYILPTTGSAARFLYDQQKNIYPKKMAEDLEKSTVYGALYHRLLWSDQTWTPPPPPVLHHIPGFDGPVDDV